MKARPYRLASGLLAAVMMMAMALPAASDEHDRPDDVPPDEPVTSDPEGAAGEDDGVIGPTSHGQFGDFDDFVSIRNVSGSGLSRLNLNTTDSIVVNADSWRLANNAGTNNFEIAEGASTNRLVVRQGGNVGLGLDNPLSPLHIERTGGFQLRMAGSGADYRMDAFGTSLRIGDSSNTNQFRIFGADAPFNALTVGNGVGVGTASPAGGLHVSNIGGAPTDALVVANGIGVGTAAPLAALDIRNITGTNVTEMRLTQGEHSWSNGVRPAGFYQFNRLGSGGAEFLVRERNHGVATIDVEGPVRATAFNTTSNKDVKTDFAAVNPLDVLASLKALPVSSWRFKGCKDGEGRLGLDDRIPTPCTGKGAGPRHVGPTAQDFQRLFGLGDGESISTVDADGIMMAAIKGLVQQLDAKDAAISELEGKLSHLESRLGALETTLPRSPRVPGLP